MTVFDNVAFGLSVRPRAARPSKEAIRDKVMKLLKLVQGRFEEWLSGTDSKTYFHLDTPRPLCGTVHNIASPEMLYCSSTSGDHFERRARQLKAHGDLIEGIVTEAERQSAETTANPTLP